MHKIYKILSYFLIPLILVNTYIRVIRGKEDKARYKERFGITTFKKPQTKDVIWIHASSIGEFKSSDFLINNFYKKYCILVTTTTKTASEYALKNYSEKIIHQFAPFDILSWINKFLKNWQPKLVIWIESDLWPNTIVSLRERKITTIFLNARISPKSFKKWKYFSSYYNFITQTFSSIYAQSKNDLERIKQLTKINVGYLGNLKFTNKKKPLPNETISKNIKIMIASTHNKEDSLIIPHLEIISKKYPLINFFISPRHPDRSKKIYDLLKSRDLDVGYQSNIEHNDYKFLIIDSFGKMDEFYNKSDIVFLGGSFTKNGGHNPIEAAVANCAIITGPNVFNWQNLYEEMLLQNSCSMINDPKELEIEILNLIENENLVKSYKKNAFKFANNIFFEEEKLLNLLNKKLGSNA
ncbi:glycosyltransferase N-terminal domain-containing protein [Alphaproteobacteria bacterium]|nr:glycosyltransferase N-terminal domain-containing protein [Alphaproteobacteria bacterium]